MNCLGYAIREQIKREGGKIRLMKWNGRMPHFALDMGAYIISFTPKEKNSTNSKYCNIVFKGFKPKRSIKLKVLGSHVFSKDGGTIDKAWKAIMGREGG